MPSERLVAGASAGRLATAFTAVVLPAACAGDETPPVPPSAGGPAATGATAPADEGLPAAVAETRAVILDAVESRDYESLRPVVDPSVFLSDYGFGEERDPVGRWQESGSPPLDVMGGLLVMPHAVRETNEGTLYQWPRFDADSRAGDVAAPERDAFLAFMTEDELGDAFDAELGYVGPRLGILADGTWWFFVLEGEQ